MDVFNDDGHISQYGLKKMIYMEASPLERLEISEHLSFCNECMEKYLSLVEESHLIDFKESVQKPLIASINKTNRTNQLKRCLTMTVAASLTMLFWVNGFFDYNQIAKGYEDLEIVKITREYKKEDNFLKKAREKFNVIFEYKLNFWEDK